MKRFRIKGSITTEVSYPYGFQFDFIIDCDNEETASAKIWNSFTEPVSMRYECEEIK